MEGEEHGQCHAAIGRHVGELTKSSNVASVDRGEEMNDILVAKRDHTPQSTAEISCMAWSVDGTAHTSRISCVIRFPPFVSFG